MLGLQMSQVLVSYFGTEERLSSLRSHLADTTRVVCGAGSTKLSSVPLFVCPSVRPSHHSAAARRCGGFTAVGPAGRRYIRSIAAGEYVGS